MCIKFKVVHVNHISSFGIIVELENVVNGIPSKSVLKSLNSNVFWEVENRIIENQFENQFDCETVIYSHLKLTTFDVDKIKEREKQNIRLYKIQ